ncbi:hypothetical protein [Curtobacterium sp. ZW137]|uniref:hypothetical protein n=1 Tax=Curtobacterium sp. ZW137 TaxID=2485104 RepID=UPI000F4BF07C|nr:hypothetical protein [Curtobacterium sp. ZW137]ROP63438.1 hypothetical protein EDF55_2192 [Curtobacterium sp. ZW137]
MDDDRSTHLVRTRLSFGQRIATWWAVSTEIHELTRDREREERVRAEAAVRLAPGPWAIADLFRRRR